jgi:hypothetical protein
VTLCFKPHTLYMYCSWYTKIVSYHLVIETKGSLYIQHSYLSNHRDAFSTKDKTVTGHIKNICNWIWNKFIIFFSSLFWLMYLAIHYILGVSIKRIRTKNHQINKNCRFLIWIKFRQFTSSVCTGVIGPYR